MKNTAENSLDQPQSAEIIQHPATANYDRENLFIEGNIRFLDNFADEKDFDLFASGEAYVATGENKTPAILAIFEVLQDIREGRSEQISRLCDSGVLSKNGIPYRWDIFYTDLFDRSISVETAISMKNIKRKIVLNLDFT
jgi:hypothetical protein